VDTPCSLQPPLKHPGPLARTLGLPICIELANMDQKST